MSTTNVMIGRSNVRASVCVCDSVCVYRGRDAMEEDLAQKFKFNHGIKNCF